MQETLRDYAARQAGLCREHDTISDDLFVEYGVNRGLRDVNGKGVLTGLTTISEIISFKDINGVRTPVDGELWYRGYKVNSLVEELTQGEFGFERTAYLLIFGEKPDEEQLKEFRAALALCRRLPTNFTRDVIMKAPSKDIMNSMTRSILTLASYDKNAADLTIENCLRQCIQLIAEFPMMACYAYHAYNHYEHDDSMYIHRPDRSLSTAENFLRMIRPDKKYTELEARVLDVAMMLHMEHGGGNNSTFTTHVVSSSLTDTYSVIAAAIGSLKGPRHGGANIKVVQMFDVMKRELKDWTDEEEVRAYLKKLLNKQAFDRSGLIYGVGHAIYSKSDPRAVIFKSFVEKLAMEKGLENEYKLYALVEELAPMVIREERMM